jgi:putative redox protein
MNISINASIVRIAFHSKKILEVRAMPEVTVVAKPQGLQHEIKTAHHTLLADAGKDIGGTETGPDPHELMLAALGACTSMTLQLFAKKRDWKLTSVNVKLREDRVDDPANPGKQISKITRDVHVEGDLTLEQLDTLKGIADKCPIHKLLTGAKQIETSLAKA